MSTPSPTLTTVETAIRKRADQGVYELGAIIEGVFVAFTSRSVAGVEKWVGIGKAKQAEAAAAAPPPTPLEPTV
jgi:hypothetical protein